MTKSDDKLENTKHLMAALGRMPPKPHEDMKLGKHSPKTAAKSSSKGAPSHPNKRRKKTQEIV
jgi:hypothetical protein